MEIIIALNRTALYTHMVILTYVCIFLQDISTKMVYVIERWGFN